GAGDDDERGVQTLLLPHLHGVQRAEAGHVVVRDDEVEARAAQGRGHGRPGVHPLPCDVPSAALELLHDELRVLFAVLDEEHRERSAHLPRPGGSAKREGAGPHDHLGSLLVWISRPSYLCRGVALYPYKSLVGGKRIPILRSRLPPPT